MNIILKFLLGDRIHKALMDEWHRGDKMIAGFVLFCVISTPLTGLLYLLALALS